MRIANGLEMLEITADLPTGPSTIYPTLIWDDTDMVLVDAGLPGQISMFRDAFQIAGAPIDRLNRAIITHHDLDHTGSLKDIIGRVPGSVQVIAHGAEQAFIQNEALQSKLAKAYAGLDDVPEPERPKILEDLAAMRANYERAKVRVDRTVADGEELPFCGGIKVIHTPGHTPGHISLYLSREKVLVAGDALFIVDGASVPCPDRFCADPAQAAQSLKRLAEYDIRAVICYHGGLFARSHTDCIFH